MNTEREERDYEALIRELITKLRVKKGVSEHRMSLDLGKSPSYIRSITNGNAMPSFQSLFNIIEYFELTPSDFFRDFRGENMLRASIYNAMLQMDDSELEKVQTIISLIRNP